MKKYFKRVTSLIFAAALTASILTGCGGSSASESSVGSAAASDTSAASESGELQTLRVAVMTGQPDQYATYIGTEEGIFEKYGIELEITEFVAGINTIDAVVNNTADVGYMADFAAVNRIGNTLHDTNLVFYSELATSSPNGGGVYVAPEYADDISKLDGSEGWITQIGTVAEYYNWQAQTALGLDPDKQNIVQTDSPQTSLALVQNGDASAVVAYGANSSYYEEQGWKLAITSEEIGFNVGSYYLTTSDYLEANTELLANYLKATQESIEFINNNLDASAEKIAAKYGVKAEDFKSTWSAYTFNVGFTEEGADHLNDINAWAVENGKYEEEYDVKDFIDVSAAEIAVPDNVTVDFSYKK